MISTLYIRIRAFRRYRNLGCLLLILLSAGPASADDTTLYYTDDFSTMTNWGSPQAQMGNWQIVSDSGNNVLQGNPISPSVDSYITWKNAISASNYCIEMKVRTLTPGPAEYDVAAIRIGEGGPTRFEVRLDRDIHGRGYNIGWFMWTAQPFPTYFYCPNPGQWNTWKFYVRQFGGNTRVEVWLNGQLGSYSTVPGAVTGRIMLRSRASTVQFDDLKVSYLWDKDVSLLLASDNPACDYLLSPEDLPATFVASGALQTAQAQALPGKKLKYSITRLDGSVVTSGEYAVTGNSFNYVLPPFTTSTAGHYTLNAAFWSDTRELFSKKLPFCVTPYLALDYDKPDVDSPFGAFSTWNPPTMLKIGMKGMVQVLYHSSIEPQPGVVSWSSVRPNDGYNGKVFSIPQAETVDSPYDLFTQIVQKMVELFPDKPQRVYSILGEPDEEMFEPDKGAQWVVDRYAICHQKVHANDPNGVLIGPELTNVDWVVPFLQQLFDAGFANHVDEISLHPYGYDAYPEVLFEQVLVPAQNLCVSYGKPAAMRFTEQGIHSTTLGFKTHADANARRWIYALSMPAKAYIEFIQTDHPIFPSSGGCVPFQSGHFSNSGNTNPVTVDPLPWEGFPWYPKPSALAHQTVARELEDVTPAGRDKISQGGATLYKMAFNKPYKHVTCVWSIPIASTTSLSPTGPYTVTDLWGNLLERSATGGTISVATDTSPKFVDQLTIASRTSIVRPQNGDGVIARDDFTSYLEGESLQNPYVPTPWTVINGNQSALDWTIRSGSLRKERMDQNGIVLVGDDSLDDYVFEATVRTVQPTPNNYSNTYDSPAIRFRYTDADGGYLLRLHQDGDIALYGRNGLIFIEDSSYRPNVRHRFRVVCEGNTISVYVDGTLIRTLADANPFTHGKAGVEVPWDTTAAIDDILITEVPSQMPGMLAGSVQLQDFLLGSSPVAVKIELLQNGGSVRTETVVLGTGGGYSLQNVVPGTYDVAFKASSWLRTVVQAVTVPGGGTGTADVSLPNGDVNGDNVITTGADHSIILRNVDRVRDP